MSPQDTELWKLSCRHFYTGTVLHLLAVQGRKVSEHFYCHQCQQLPKSTQPWSNLQNGCIAFQLTRGKCCEGRKCTQLQDQHRYIFKCLPDPARSMTETVQRYIPFQYHTKYCAKSTQETVPFEYHTQYQAETVQRTIPFQYHTQYCTSSIQRTVLLQYCAHQLGKTQHHGTAHGTTNDFFQDHHILHSYHWKNDNKTGQSSTYTSRNFM